MLGRKVTVGVLINAASAVAGVVGLAVVARHFPPQSLGMVAFGIAVASMAGTFSNLALDTANVRFLAAGIDPEKCHGTFWPVRLILIATVSGLLFAAVMVWESWFGFTDATSLSVLILGILYGMGFQLRMAAASWLKAFQLAAKIQLVPAVETFARVLFLVGVVWAARGWFGTGEFWTGLANTPERAAILIAFAYVLGVAVAAGVGLRWASQLFPRRSRFDRDLLRTFFAYSIPLTPAIALAAVNIQIDHVMIGYFWNSYQVGGYFAAQRLSYLLAIAPAIVGTLFLPLVTRFAAAGEDSAARVAIRSVTRMTTLLMMPFVLWFLIFPRQGIHIFLSDQFLFAAPIVATFGLYALVVALTTIQTSVLQAYGFTKRVGVASIVAAVANLILNLFLIPKSVLFLPGFGLGAFGAAIGTTLAELIRLAMFLQLSRGKLHIPMAGRSLLLQIATIALTGWVFTRDTVQGAFGDLDRVWELAGIGVASVLFYATVMFLVRGIRREDIRLIAQALHPGEMGKYVVTEMRRRKDD